MTDKELLELAARAAGLEVWTDIDGNLYTCTQDLLEKPWNPLTDYGDAMRLAVDLKLFPQMAIMGSLVGFDGMDIFEPFSPEPQAATRRAITRAAAEIGKQK